MPELPEVETVVRDLQPTLVGRRITAIQVSDKALRRPWSSAWVPLLVGQRVQHVQRRGKWIVIGLERDLHLVIHLGMSGQLMVEETKQPVGDHTHLIFDLNRGQTQLRFRDIRRFGSATLIESAAALHDSFTAAGLGPEPFGLAEPAGSRYWRQQLAKTDRCLKAVLLDQRVVAGVGNIYADESLFEARLHPARCARDLTAAEANRLRRAIVTVLERAIARRGSSIKNYVGGSGLKGEYQNEFRAYGQTGRPCPRCRTPIARIRLAGRSTHYCPHCQLAVQGPKAKVQSPRAADDRH